MQTYSFDEIMSIYEAAHLWNLDTSTIRYAIARGNFHDDEIRKSGGTWLITKPAMERVYNSSITAKLYTVGYEGKAIGDFIEQLCNNGIQLLLDVRAYPISRKKGFSKNQLSEYLLNSGIEYISMPELGSPKSAREALKQNHDYDEFFYLYENWLDTQEDSLYAARSMITNNCEMKCCLMCFEKKPEECHRSLLAKKLRDIQPNAIEIYNI